MVRPAAQTDISWYDETRIFVRGHNLCDDLIGRITLVDYLHMLTMGVMPSPAERSIIEASIVALAEHGLTPSTIAARLTYMGAPESLQGAIAAGLLGVGDQFVGTVELVAPLLQEIVESSDDEAASAAIVQRYQQRKALLPGFGQPHHKPDDPRPAALFRVAEQAGVTGNYIAALQTLGRQVDAAAGKHITINAPGAVSALFLEIGLPVRIMRGYIAVGRCIGLVGHLAEEQQHPIGRALWEDGSTGVAKPAVPPRSG